MNHRIEIVEARREDVASVMRVIHACTQAMRHAGISQWDEIYPNSGVIEEDAREGFLYIAQENGICRGAVTLSERQEATYRQVQWSGSEPVLVVHRLCVDPVCQGQGIAGQIMDFAEELALRRGYAGIRLDAYSDNPRAVGLYERRGYRNAGQVFFPRRDLPFFCFEKVFAAQPDRS